MNILTILEMAADSFPDRVAVTCGDIQLNYATLLRAARATAVDVRAKKVSYLGHLALSSPATPIALFAAAAAGIPFVPLNYRLTAEELEALVERIVPAQLIADREYSISLMIPPGSKLIDRGLFLRDAMKGATVPGEPPGEEAVAVQIFTSGTTGQPKAALLRHENLFSYIVGSVEFASAAEDEATLVTAPPYHIAAVSAILSSTYACRRIVQLPNFEPGEWLRLCRTERITNAFLVPTMLRRVVEHLKISGAAADVPSLRAVAYGGGPMPLPVIEQAMALFPSVDFTNAYGLTETSSTITLLSPDDHRAAAASTDPRVRHRLASVGRALPAIELELRDDGGKTLGPDTAGRVHVRGPQVSGEYGGTGSLRDDDGWFDTRDRGFLDSEGYLFLEGRADDVIVRGGENISPGEIEEVLLSHPAVGEVAVVGVPDDEWGEAVAAAIVLRQSNVDPGELQSWVKERLRSSRVPGKIRFVDQLPYSEVGKLLRRVVRQEMLAP